MPNRATAALCFAIALSPGLASATDNGFATFWKSFAAAVRTDDKTALASMVVLGPGLDESATTFAQLHAHVLGPKTRSCLASAKPVRDTDGNGAVNYSVACGEVIFVFYATKTGWKLTDAGPDD